MITAKIYKRRKAEIQPNGRVKRTGRIYYEVAYWTGRYWLRKDFDNRIDAKEFAKQYA